MRRPIKTFSVELRRTGRKPPVQPLQESSAPAPFEPPAPPRRPREDAEDSYHAALRAADAVFDRPAILTPSAEAAASDSQRRILQTLDEEDPIVRLLAQEEEQVPVKRGRKPREPGAPQLGRRPRPKALLVDEDIAPTPPLTEPTPAVQPAPPTRIKGYMRGLIYSRYARHDMLRPGEEWRKRGLKARW